MVSKVNLLSAANLIKEINKYDSIGFLNDHMLNIIVTQDRTLDFHIHDDSDEMFYVIEGKFELEFDDAILEINAGDLIIVPKGIRHRPVIKSPVKCLLIEKSGTLNEGNTGGSYRS